MPSAVKARRPPCIEPLDGTPRSGGPERRGSGPPVEGHRAALLRTVPPLGSEISPRVVMARTWRWESNALNELSLAFDGSVSQEVSVDLY